MDAQSFSASPAHAIALHCGFMQLNRRCGTNIECHFFWVNIGISRSVRKPADGHGTSFPYVSLSSKEIVHLSATKTTKFHTVQYYIKNPLILNTYPLILLTYYAKLPTMASLTSDDVRHIAKLCRLNIAEDQLDIFAKELTSILSFVDSLKEVDTQNIEPTPQATGITNRFREDALCTDEINPKDILECSGLPIVDNQIQTPSAHG